MPRRVITILSALALVAALVLHRTTRTDEPAEAGGKSGSIRSATASPVPARSAPVPGPDYDATNPFAEAGVPSWIPRRLPGLAGARAINPSLRSDGLSEGTIRFRPSSGQAGRIRDGVRAHLEQAGLSASSGAEDELASVHRDKTARLSFVPDPSGDDSIELEYTDFKSSCNGCPMCHPLPPAP